MDKSIRVLHVLDKISINSGVSSVVMNYFKYCERSNVVFDFMVHEPIHDTLKKMILCRGSKIFYMPRLCLSNLFLYHKMLNDFFLQHHEYKIVHGHIANASAFYLRSAKKNGVPIRILHSHNARGADTFFKCVRNRILSKIGIHYANWYFSCSDNASNYLFGRKTSNKHQIMLLPNAIPVHEFSYNQLIREKFRKKLGITENQVLIGHVGRFCKQKNHTLLIDIFSEVHKSQKDAILILLGDGELMDKIHTKVKHLHLESAVLFMGSKQNVNDYLQAMDIFVFPSLYEGFPVVCVEAQASGLSCIISDSITKKVSFTNKTTFLNLAADLSIWSNKILESGKKVLSDEIPRVSGASNIIAAGYDIESVCQKLEEYYKFSIENIQ